jgi:exosome complex RNA-binding protein Csl4
MTIVQRGARIGAMTLMVGALGACANTGGLGSVLGSVLGGGSQSQVTGTVRSVDTRGQQISIQQSDGRTVTVTYDNQTQVVYQNRNYPVTSLEYGDQVTARIQSTANNRYYTDLIQVDQSVSGSTSTGSGSANVQSLQGTVRQVDTRNGLFTVDTGGNVILTVSVPYGSNNADLTRFQNLRSGDYVRFYGVFVNTSRVELRQFY